MYVSRVKIKSMKLCAGSRGARVANCTNRCSHSSSLSHFQLRVMCSDFLVYELFAPRFAAADFHCARFCVSKQLTAIKRNRESLKQITGNAQPSRHTDTSITRLTSREREEERERIVNKSVMYTPSRRKRCENY